MKQIKAETKEHLQNLISQEIDKNGNFCSLNHIDVSAITDMSHLFIDSEFNGNISQWDTSGVIVMTAMFYGSSFNGDISNWDISNAVMTNYMFQNSKFNGNISTWKPNPITIMYRIFENSDFTGDLRTWGLDEQALKKMFGEPSFESYQDRRRLIEEMKMLKEKFTTHDKATEKRKTL